MFKLQRRYGFWLIFTAVWWLITELVKDSLFGKLNAWLESTSWYKTMLEYVIVNPWLIPVISFAGLGVYVCIRASMRESAFPAQGCPIKSVSPSQFHSQLDFVSNERNRITGQFQVSVSLDIEVENDTGHILKIAGSNLIIAFGDEISVRSDLFHKLNANGVPQPVQQYPIEIQPYSTAKENIYVLDYFDVITVEQKYWNTAPKKASVRFELVGAVTPELYFPVKFDIGWQGF